MNMLILVILFIIILIGVPLMFLLMISIIQRRAASRAQAERAEMEQRLAGSVLSAATIVSARVLNRRESGDMLTIRLTLRVEPPDAESYTAWVTWEVEGVMEQYLRPGQPVSVKIDPQDPKRIYPNVGWATYSLAQAA